ncbi:MAG TPA: HAMP domain-containing sensor histidine kinase [Candidatus Saccharimonadales bacterium]|jgi:signal transduction histidine kinase
MTQVKFQPHPKAPTNYFSKWDRNLLSLTHELSGPLTAARLNLERYLAGNSKQSLEMLNSNLKLMEDYLTTAKQLIKKQPVPNKVFSVNKQLANITRNLSPVAAQRSVSVKMNVIDDCGLHGNATRFKQIISCFIRNAIEAYDGCLHDSKSVIIEHYHIPGYLVISIRDHGNGIAEEDKTNIFKPYFSTKRTSSGLGLGLSLAAESIAEDFKGRVKLESVKSRGTVFSLFFKLPNNRY